MRKLLLGLVLCAVTVYAVLAATVFSSAATNPGGQAQVPPYTVPTGLTATFGDVLGDVTLPDGWAWVTPTDYVGNAGSNAHAGTYTPVISGNFLPVTANINIMVAQATPQNVVSPTGLVAVFGAELSTVNLPSDWAWVTPTDLVGNAGTRTHDALYTPSDTNFYAVTRPVSIEVSQATPTNIIIPVLNAVYGQSLIQVTGLPSEWEWTAPGNLVGGVGRRVHNAIYTPTDTNFYSVTRQVMLNVTHATLTIATPNVSATFGQVLSQVTLPFGWVWANPNDSVGATGIQLHDAVFTPNNPNYNVINVSIAVDVVPAEYSNVLVPVTLTAIFGVTLADIAHLLPAGWTWQDDTALVGNVGTRAHVATFTPVNSNYLPVTREISVAVTQATPTVTIPLDFDAVYGQRLSEFTLPSGWTWHDPNALVGGLGHQTHVIWYTPSNTNFYAVEQIITLYVAAVA